MIRYYVRVRTKEQLRAALQWEKTAVLMPDGELGGDMMYVHAKAQKASNPMQIVICLPDVLRQSRLAQTEAAMMAACTASVKGAGLLVRNLDELGMIQALHLQERFPGALIADPFLYAYNSEALRFYLDLFPDLWFIGSDELTDREQQQALQKSPLPKEKMIIKVYGHQPLMISNQCLNRNHTNCTEHVTAFCDSRKERFFAVSSCLQCYSTVYNGKCTWLLDKVNEEGYAGYENLLLDFTVEDGPEMEHLLSSISQGAFTVSGRSDQHMLQNSLVQTGNDGANGDHGYARTGRKQVPDHMTRAHHYKGVE